MDWQERHQRGTSRGNGWQGERGATALTYGLVLGLVSMFALGAVTSVGDSIGGLFTAVSDDLCPEGAGTCTVATTTPEPSPSAGPATLVTVNGARQWSDNSVAEDCESYRRPTGQYTYTGETGDGDYRIQPPGVSAPFVVRCDMTVEDGGWIRLTFDDPQGTDDKYIGRSYSSGNGLTQCWGDQFKYFNHISGRDGDPSNSGGGDDNSSWQVLTNNSGSGDGNGATYPLTWRNPADGQPLTSAQLAGLRDHISDLATATRMTTVKCDCDYEDAPYQWKGTTSTNWDHNARIRAADNSYLFLTLGRCPDNNSSSYATYWLHGAGSSASTTEAQGNDHAGVSAVSLPAKFILPAQVQIRNGSGGGVGWGYQQDYVLVK